MAPDSKKRKLTDLFFLGDCEYTGKCSKQRTGRQGSFRGDVGREGLRCRCEIIGYDFRHFKSPSQSARAPILSLWSSWSLFTFPHLAFHTVQFLPIALPDKFRVLLMGVTHFSTPPWTGLQRLLPRAGVNSYEHNLPFTISPMWTLMVSPMLSWVEIV